MKRVITVTIAALLLCLQMTACGQPQQGQSSIPEPSAPERKPAAQQDSPILPDDPVLANLVTALRGADLQRVQINNSDMEKLGDAGLRVTPELLGRIADILAVGSYTLLDEEEEDIYGPKAGERFTILLNPENVSDDPYSHVEFIKFSSGSLYAPDRMVLALPEGEGLPLYLFDISAYNQVRSLLSHAAYDYSNALTGDYIPVSSSYYGDSSLPSPSLLGALEFADMLLFCWNLDGREGPTLFEAVDAETGENLYRFQLDGYAEAIEKSSLPGYDYRVGFADSVVYRSVSDPAAEMRYQVPDSVVPLLWREMGNAFDVDPEADKLIWCAADGIYLSGCDGKEPALLLSNRALPSLLEGEEMSARADSQLHYVAPVLMNGGRQVVSTMYLAENGDYDGACHGVTVADLETEESYSLTGIFNWLAGPARRIDSMTIGALGYDGYRLIDVQSGDERISDYNWNEAFSYDYGTFLEVQSGRDANGEAVQLLVSYTPEDGDDKTAVLTASSEKLYLWGVTESYAVCIYGSGDMELILVRYR